MDEERFPNYFLAVYSSRGVLIDPLPMPDFCVADTLLLVATTKGKRHEVNSRLLGTLRSDNDYVHENVAEK